MVRIRLSELGGSGRTILVPGAENIHLEASGSAELSFEDFTSFGTFLADQNFRGLVEAKVLRWEVLPEPPAPTPIVHYRMRARDLNASTVTYRHWSVTTTPDLDASRYTGEHHGSYVNFTDITVMDSFTV